MAPTAVTSPQPVLTHPSRPPVSSRRVGLQAGLQVGLQGQTWTGTRRGRSAAMVNSNSNSNSNMSHVPRRPCHVMQESTHFQGSRPGPVHLPLTSRSAPGPKTGDRAESVSKPFVLGVSNGPLEAHPRRAHSVYQRLLLRSYLHCTSEHARDGPPQAHHHLSISQSVSQSARRQATECNVRQISHASTGAALHPPSPPISDARHLPSSPKL